MILRKLVTNDWVLVSPGLVSEDEGRMGAVEITCAFLVDFCWEVQMEKNGVTIKRRNSF